MVICPISGRRWSRTDHPITLNPPPGPSQLLEGIEDKFMQINADGIEDKFNETLRSLRRAQKHALMLSLLHSLHSQH